MAEIEETKLPGVGVRHDFPTKAGRRVGVITHRAGHRELLLYDPDDPDTCTETVRLDESETQALAELLGASQVTASLSQLQQSVEGLAIDWVGLGRDWWCVGRSLGDTQLRRRTGVSVVALIRDETTIPSPMPDQVLLPADTAVVVGTPPAIKRAVERLREGT